MLLHCRLLITTGGALSEQVHIYYGMSCKCRLDFHINQSISQIELSRSSTDVNVAFVPTNSSSGG